MGFNIGLGRTATQVACIGALLVPGAAFLHTSLAKSFPKKGDVLTEAPTQVRLWFTGRPEVELSKIILMGPDSEPVRMGDAAATDDTLSVAAPIRSPLTPGRYMVEWRTGSKDGHVVRGRFHFTYESDAASPSRSR